MLLVAPARAQLGVCAWNGSGLTCPIDAPPAVIHSDRYDPLGRLQESREQAQAHADAQADFARRVAAERQRREVASAERRRSADALVGSGQCAAAEALARSSSDADVLMQVQTSCAGRPEER